MLNNGWYWQEQLIRDARYLRRLDSFPRGLTEPMYGRAERVAVGGMFSVRRLIECRKVPDRLAIKNVCVLAAPVRGRRITTRNNHRLDENYVWDRTERTSMPLVDFANQFIHSFILLPINGHDGGLWGYAVVSDYHSPRRVLTPSTGLIATVLERVGRARVTSIVQRRIDPKAHDWDYVACANEEYPHLNPEDERGLMAMIPADLTPEQQEAFKALVPPELLSPEEK
jgi:hypothetical protein